VRLVNAEGDGAPGLIVDRYDGYLVVEFLTGGMARRAETFAEILGELTGCAGILERPEAELTRMEALSRTEAVLFGTKPPDLVEIVEGPAKFLVDLRRGQKTGFYLDQRDNRLRAAELARGRRVLDAFCYTGGFSVHAALAGARSVFAVDSSEVSIELARRNAELNGVAAEFARGNAFERLRMLQLEGQRFDMVILDPPKLARSRPGLAKALAAYKDANLSALKLLEPGGILVTCCCSGLVSEQDFLRAVNDAAVDAGRSVTIVERRGASADHPFVPACPETDYLQCLVARVAG
jgi:23S rRNA (cytosine1962-C5)-methyltransferase